ncbi:O-acyltransferase WSD1-like [Quillaja saponaria]|uniref:O-acyltransferase WSD1-like n=1 Tax=Quillaja saponaria TaxID=32244 RepID=A0AAD7PSK7_QUISA|nr:O-acyltransferase WSD1-like [Quillaja saponaria]
MGSMADESIGSEQALSPAARLFHAPNFNCYIIAIIGCKTKICPQVLKDGLQHTLLKQPRFSSKLVKKGRKVSWTPTTVNLDNHVITPEIDTKSIDFPDQFVEDYISNFTRTPLDICKPLWEFHVLNIKTSDAESVGVFRIHHSIGDGASLISLLLACTRKTTDPEVLPTTPTTKKRSTATGSGNYSNMFCACWVLLAIWRGLMFLWNTLVDLVLFVATILFLKDSKTPLKGDLGVDLNTKRFVHRTVSLDDIKLVKNAMDMTINDVLLGITQAGFTRYLNRTYSDDANRKANNLPKSIRLRASILVNLRPTAGIQDLADMMAKNSKTGWGNWIGYIILPFTIALQDDPLEYIRQAKATIDRKKHSFESVCTYWCARFVLNLFGTKVAATITRRVLFNTTIAFSNVVGPQEEISFYGLPITYLAPSVYGHPQALTIHYQSYINKMTISMAVDPNVISDPHLLCNDLEESLKLIPRCQLLKKASLLILSSIELYTDSVNLIEHLRNIFWERKTYTKQILLLD